MIVNPKQCRLFEVEGGNLNETPPTNMRKALYNRENNFSLFHRLGMFIFLNYYSTLQPSKFRETVNTIKETTNNGESFCNRNNFLQSLRNKRKLLRTKVMYHNDTGMLQRGMIFDYHTATVSGFLSAYEYVANTELIGLKKSEVREQIQNYLLVIEDTHTLKCVQIILLESLLVTTYTKLNAIIEPIEII